MPRKNKKLKTYIGQVGEMADGTPICKPFYGLTKKEAKEKADTYIAEIEFSNHRVSENEYYFRGWAKKWLLLYKKPNVTPLAYKTTYLLPVTKHLIPLLGDKLMADITHEDIVNLYNEKNFLSKSICSKISMCLNAIFETAIFNDICYKNPARFAHIESQAVPHVKEIYDDKGIKLAQRWFLKNMTEVALDFEVGVRRGEMCGFMKTDFDLRRGTYRVERAIRDEGGTLLVVPPKDDSRRTNPLSPIGKQVVKLLFEKYPDSPWLIPGEDGGPMSPINWSAMLKKAMTSFVKEFPFLPPLTSHEIRHTVGTFLRRQGVDIYTIALILGHKSIEVTANTYVHNELIAIRRATSKIYRKQELIAA